MNDPIKKTRHFLKKLGPGFITGASDDDPSGILTYLQTGVVWGTRALWTVLITLPLMCAIQEMCGRIGYVTRKGLIKILKENYSRPILYFIALISAAVIILNIGVDLLAIGISLENISSINRLYWIPIMAAFILVFIIFFSFKKFTRIMKWLALSLFFYVIVVFYLKVDWSAALQSTFIPSFKWSKEIPLLLAAILGTTISPYLFYWQTSEEMEIKKSHHTIKVATSGELATLREDTFSGMFLSNFIMWFIILGASQLGGLYGITEITSFEQASLVLKPLLGAWASLIFNLGIIGTGLLAIPVLASSVGYILAETFNWKEGISKKFWQAKSFYFSIIGATLLGILTVLININAIQLLIYAALFYAIITPLLIYFIMRIANDKKIMGNKTNSKLSNIFGWLAFVIITGAVLSYFFTLI